MTMNPNASAFEPSTHPSTQVGNPPRVEDYDRAPGRPPGGPPPHILAAQAAQAAAMGLPPGPGMGADFLNFYGHMAPPGMGGPMPPWGPTQLGAMPPWGAPMSMAGYPVLPHPPPSQAPPNPVARKVGFIAVLYNLPQDIKDVVMLKDQLAMIDFHPLDIKRIDANGGKSMFVAIYKDETERNQCVSALHEAIDVFECHEGQSQQSMGCIEWPCHKGDKPPSWVLHLLQFNLIYGVKMIHEKKPEAEAAVQ
mmetsp:Transcript_6420/g.11162  ORF Transcript_6420/g.11162 Transcript_6420/m.11162 type:complete len:251 (+) Transcript_6420:34-786(+)